ncbi:pre-60S ribosomal particles component, variant 2 [Balamuthia mandrillaris]
MGKRRRTKPHSALPVEAATTTANVNDDGSTQAETKPREAGSSLPKSQARSAPLKAALRQQSIKQRKKEEREEEEAEQNYIIEEDEEDEEEEEEGGENYSSDEEENGKSWDEGYEGDSDLGENEKENAEGWDEDEPTETRVGEKRKRGANAASTTGLGESFAAALGKILEAGTGTQAEEDTPDPILKKFKRSKDKRLEREEEKKRREERELARKKKLLANKDHHVPQILEDADDKRLRKTATKGGL